jgi:hypothetical protein
MASIRVLKNRCVSSGVIRLAEFTELQKFLLQEALDRYEEEYKELLDTWRDLERKAQATITIAGAFLAGVFAFARQSGPPVSLEVKIFLVFAITLIVIVFLFSISVFSVRERHMAPSSAMTYRFVMDLLRDAEDTAEGKKDLEERTPFFLGDMISSWQGINEELIRLNRIKAGNLWKSHVVLIAAAMVVFVLIILSIFTI